MGEFWHFLRSFLTPFFDPKKVIFLSKIDPPCRGVQKMTKFWPPPTGGGPKKGVPDPIFPSNLAISPSKRGAVDRFFTPVGTSQNQFYCGILVRKWGSEPPFLTPPPFLGVFGPPDRGGQKWPFLTPPKWPPHFGGQNLTIFGPPKMTPIWGQTWPPLSTPASFLYILFTLVLGHILHKKYVGISWENFTLFSDFLGVQKWLFWGSKMTPPDLGV